MGRRTYKEKGKVPMHLLLMPALGEVAEVLAHGNAKPGRGAFNWRRTRIRRSDQVSGVLRHIEKSENGEELDAESRRRHWAHVAARAFILMDAQDHGTLIDTRVTAKRKGRRR